jgi:phosphatidylglycerol:prolipoprotein diacylglycerol transferase
MPLGSAERRSVSLHPVQLYEAAFCFALFIALVTLARRSHLDGAIILSYTIAYAIGRFVLEFFRGDADRGFLFGGFLSTSQAIAVLLLVCSALAWRVRRASPVRA